MSRKRVAITTFDNPYDPFDQFVDWFLFDVEKHYNTCSLMARLSHLSDDMIQKEEDEEVERVIDRIIELDFRNIYRKIVKQPTNNTTTTTE